MHLILIFQNVFLNKVTILLEKYFIERERALRYIHPRTLYVGFTVRVGVKIR